MFGRRLKAKSGTDEVSRDVCVFGEQMAPAEGTEEDVSLQLFRMLRLALLFAWWAASAGEGATAAAATTATACDAPGGGPEMAATAVGEWAGRTRIRFVTVATGSYVESAIYQARTIMALGSWRPCDILIVCTDRLCSSKLQSYHEGIIPYLLFDTSPHCRNQSDLDSLRGRTKVLEVKARMRCLISTAKVTKRPLLSLYVPLHSSKAPHPIPGSPTFYSRTQSRVTIDLMRGGETVLFMDLDVYFFQDPLRHLKLDPKAVSACACARTINLRPEL